MWSPVDAKLYSKGKNLGTTNDLDQWFLNLATHLGLVVNQNFKNEKYVSVLWVSKKWETVIDKS